MSRMPRFLPLVVVAVGGVLAVKAASGVAGLPDLMAGAKAWAEEAAPAAKTAKGGKAQKDRKAAPDDQVAANDKTGQGPLPAGLSIKPPAAPAPAVCAPTPAELARQAGLSPAELQVLQSLGARRGQLDQREKDMDVQLALLAAAEAKLDAKLKTMNGLKGDIQGLLGQAEAQKQAEQDRLVRVYESMKPKDAASRMAILTDEVRLPIAAKMKDRALSAVLAQMPAAEAKALTEKLSNRMAAAEAAREALAAPPAAAPAQAAAAPATDAAKAKPQRRPQRKAASKAKPQGLAQGRSASPAAAPAPAAPAKAG